MRLNAGTSGLILSMALIGGCGGNMKTRGDLNQGIDSLSASATTLDNSYTGLTSAVNLTNGSFLALGRLVGIRGGSVNMPVLFFKGKGSVAAVQFDVTIPAGLTFQSVTVGAAATAAGKQVSSNPITGGVRVLVFGINQTLIGSGVLATLVLGVSAGAAVAPASLGIVGVTASNAAGTSVQITASTGTVSIQ